MAQGIEISSEFSRNANLLATVQQETSGDNILSTGGQVFSPLVEGSLALSRMFIVGDTPIQRGCIEEDYNQLEIIWSRPETHEPNKLESMQIPSLHELLSQRKAIQRKHLLQPADEVALGRAVQAGKKARQQLETTYSYQQQTVLKKQIDDATLASEEFVLSNISLSKWVIKKNILGIRPDEREEVEASALFHLVRAVDKFDPEIGNKFSTFAYSVIKNGLITDLYHKKSIVHYPKMLLQRLAECNKVADVLKKELQRDPTIEELAATANFTVDYIRTLQAIHVPLSLEQQARTIEEDGEELGSMLADRGSNTEQLAIQSVSLSELWDLLTENERRVLEFRFNSPDGKMLSFQEVADKIGRTRQNVEQTERRALEKLRKILSSENNGMQETLEEISEYLVDIEKVKTLSLREYEVFVALVKGLQESKGKKDVARALSITPKTINNYIIAICGKLNIDRFTDILHTENIDDIFNVKIELSPKVVENAIIDRERNMLSYMSKGYSNKKIATLLNVPEGTFSEWKVALFRRLGVSDTQSAVMIGINKGEIMIDELSEDTIAKYGELPKEYSKLLELMVNGISVRKELVRTLGISPAAITKYKKAMTDMFGVENILPVAVGYLVLQKKIAHVNNDHELMEAA